MESFDVFCCVICMDGASVSLRWRHDCSSQSHRSWWDRSSLVMFCAMLILFYTTKTFMTEENSVGDALTILYSWVTKAAGESVLVVVVESICKVYWDPMDYFIDSKNGRQGYNKVYSPASFTSAIAITTTVCRHIRSSPSPYLPHHHTNRTIIQPQRLIAQLLSAERRKLSVSCLILMWVSINECSTAVAVLESGRAL